MTIYPNNEQLNHGVFVENRLRHLIEHGGIESRPVGGFMVTIKEHSFKVLCEHKAKIYERFNVESPAVFGSVVKGTATPNSDVDILVIYNETPVLFAFPDLKRYLESLF